MSKDFISPYPDKCPEWAKVGAKVKRLRPMKLMDGLIEMKDDITYVITSIHWLDPVNGKGLWGIARLRIADEESDETWVEYICDIREAS